MTADFNCWPRRAFFELLKQHGQYSHQRPGGWQQNDNFLFDVFARRGTPFPKRLICHFFWQHYENIEKTPRTIQLNDSSLTRTFNRNTLVCAMMSCAVSLRVWSMKWTQGYLLLTCICALNRVQWHESEAICFRPKISSGITRTLSTFNVTTQS